MNFDMQFDDAYLIERIAIEIRKAIVSYVAEEFPWSKMEAGQSYYRDAATVALRLAREAITGTPFDK